MTVITYIQAHPDQDKLKPRNENGELCFFLLTETKTLLVRPFLF